MHGSETTAALVDWCVTSVRSDVCAVVPRNENKTVRRFDATLIPSSTCCVPTCTASCAWWHTAALSCYMPGGCETLKTGDMLRDHCAFVLMTRAHDEGCHLHYDDLLTRVVSMSFIALISSCSRSTLLLTVATASR